VFNKAGLGLIVQQSRPVYCALEIFPRCSEGPVACRRQPVNQADCSSSSNITHLLAVRQVYVLQLLELLLKIIYHSLLLLSSGKATADAACCVC
jgi:hypothetical protein